MKLPFKRLIALLGAIALALPWLTSAQKAPTSKPTIVLVHGAFADSSS